MPDPQPDRIDQYKGYAYIIGAACVGTMLVLFGVAAVLHELRPCGT